MPQIHDTRYWNHDRIGVILGYIFKINVRQIGYRFLHSGSQFGFFFKKKLLKNIEEPIPGFIKKKRSLVKIVKKKNKEIVSVQGEKNISEILNNVLKAPM